MPSANMITTIRLATLCGCSAHSRADPVVLPRGDLATTRPFSGFGPERPSSTLNRGRRWHPRDSRQHHLALARTAGGSTRILIEKWPRCDGRSAKRTQRSSLRSRIWIAKIRPSSLTWRGDRSDSGTIRDSTPVARHRVERFQQSAEARPQEPRGRRSLRMKFAV